MASSVSDTAAPGSSGRSSTSRCSPPKTKTPRKRIRERERESGVGNRVKCAFIILLPIINFEMLKLDVFSTY